MQLARMKEPRPILPSSKESFFVDAFSLSLVEEAESERDTK